MRNSTSQWHCLHIYEAKGDSAEAEGCRSFLPAGYSALVQLPSLEYLAKPDSIFSTS